MLNNIHRNSFVVPTQFISIKFPFIIIHYHYQTAKSSSPTHYNIATFHAHINPQNSSFTNNPITSTYVPIIIPNKHKPLFPYNKDSISTSQTNKKQKDFFFDQMKKKVIFHYSFSI
jgi:hypothetical protein